MLCVFFDDMGVSEHSGLLTCCTSTLACLCVVILRVTSGATPAFSSNSGIHYKSVYTASHLPHTSLMQAEEGMQQWDMNPGSSCMPRMLGL